MPRRSKDSGQVYDLSKEMRFEGNTYNSSQYLYAWYQFDTDVSSAGSLPDKSGNSRDLTPADSDANRPQAPTSDAPFLTTKSPTGFPNKSAQFSNDLLEFDDPSGTDDISFGSASSNSDSPFSVSVWFKASGAQSTIESTSQYMVAKYKSDTNDREWLLWLNNGRPQIFLSNDGGTSAYVLNTHNDTVQSNEWSHVLFTYDGNESNPHLVIYLNGKVDKVGAGTFSYNGMTGEKSGHFSIGNQNNGGDSIDFVGSFAEVAVWSTALGPGEVETLYRSREGLYKSRSGYINLPPRIEIRNRDNSTGSYPTILRMGDKDRKGTYTNLFNDSHTLDFGKRIEDNFELRDQDRRDGILFFGNAINRNSWKFSDGMVIRTELYDVDDQKSIVGSALVFAGPPDSDNDNAGDARFLQTRDKIKNPEVDIEFIVGPYDKIRTALGAGLGLEFPKDSLKIQVSLDAGSWTTIKTIEGGADNLFSASSDTLREEFDRKFNTRHKVNVKLYRTDFDKVPWAGSGTPFYLRIAQTTISNQNHAYWAINKIRIDHYSGNKSYPLLTNLNNFVGQRILSGAVASPHVRPTITAEGRSVAGVSDVHIKFTPGEGISAFDDSRIELDPDEEFFRVGTKNEFIPGFESSLFSKTQITVDLSPSTEVPFGMISGSTGDSPELESDTKVKQPLMVYWNNTKKQWNHVAQGISGNAATGSLADMIQSGALGFSAIDMVAQGSSREALDLVGPAVLNSYVRPTTTFGFPFEGKYHGSDEQTVRASDLGITKPFVLEKCQIRFECKFGFAQDKTAAAPGDASEEAYALIYGLGLSDSTSDRGSDLRQRVYIPTFFILNQRPFDKYDMRLKYRIDQAGSFVERTRNISSPSVYNLSNNEIEVTGSSRVSVTSSRDLVTYGQMTMFVSSSGTGDISYIDLNGAIDGGLRRDAVVDLLATGSTPTFKNLDTISALTSSFTINFPCRMSGIIDGGSRLRVTEGTSGSTTDSNTGLWLNNTLGGRSRGGMNSNARGLVGGSPTYNPAGEYLTFGTSINTSHPALTLKVADPESMDIFSPYIIYPEDELIFGWQYPATNKIRECAPGGNATIFNDMTLFGKSTLTLFGSQVKDQKEFHETVNQNLGSDAIHEAIGSEPAIDRFKLSLPIDNFGNTYDNFVASSTANPIKRVGSLVRSRLTSPRGDAAKAKGSIEIPAGNKASLIFSSSGGSFGLASRFLKGGFNDGDLIRLQDSQGNVGFFYGFKKYPWGPQDNAIRPHASGYNLKNPPTHVATARTAIAPTDDEDELVDGIESYTTASARLLGSPTTTSDANVANDRIAGVAAQDWGSRTDLGVGFGIQFCNLLTTSDFSVGIGTGATRVYGVSFFDSGSTPTTSPLHYPASGSNGAPTYHIGGKGEFGYAQVFPGGDHTDHGGDTTDVYSFRVYGGDTSAVFGGPVAGFTPSVTDFEAFMTLTSLAVAIADSNLRMTAAFVDSARKIEITQTDISSNGNTQIQRFKASSLVDLGRGAAGRANSTSMDAKLEDRYYLNIEKFEGGTGALIAGAQSSFTGVNNLFDGLRVFADSFSRRPHHEDSGFNFGTFQSLGPVRPKYYADNRRFGHFADLIQQGRDGKTVSIPLLSRAEQQEGSLDGDSLQAPTQTIFVSGTVGAGPLGIKTYTRKAPTDSVNTNVDASINEFFTDPDQD